MELVTSREAWLPVSGEGVADLARLALQPAEAIACRGLHALAALHDVVLQGGPLHPDQLEARAGRGKQDVCAWLLPARQHGMHGFPSA